MRGSALAIRTVAFVTQWTVWVALVGLVSFVLIKGLGARPPVVPPPSNPATGEPEQVTQEMIEGSWKPFEINAESQFSEEAEKEMRKLLDGR